MAPAPNPEDLKSENDELRRRLEEAESIVSAIRKHEVDAFVVQHPEGESDVLVLDGEERPYRLMIERMQQGAAVIGAEGSIVYVNGRLSEMLEAPAATLLGARFSKCVAAAHRDGFEDLFRRVPRGDSEIEVTLVRANGTDFPALLNLTPMFNTDGVQSLMVTDLTQQKRHAQEREHLVREQAARAAAEQVAEVLRTADRRKDEFLAMLGHELRNPLAPMRNALQILNLIGSRELAARQTREMMGRQLEGLIRLVDDLLDVGRVTQGKIELQAERTDLRHIVTRALESARTTIDERGHTVELRMAESPLLIEGDIVRLTQVVLNLLNNAAKFTPPGGRIQVSAEADDAAPRALIRIRDNGIGIEPDMLGRVFDLFTQADRSTGRVEGGLGIGLTLARRLVEMHDGTLDAASAGAGQGSEFTLRLPLSEHAIEAPQAHAADSAVSKGSVPAMRIMVVDDNQDAAASLTMLLRLFGHDVREAYDGQTALTLLRDFVPDLLLLDIGLPGMNGYEVARQVRAVPALRNIRLVALSGYGSEEDRRTSVAAGFDAHFVKPVEFSSIQSLIAST
jgi:PAS domain S-box-containing protein